MDDLSGKELVSKIPNFDDFDCLIDIELDGIENLSDQDDFMGLDNENN